MTAYSPIRSAASEAKPQQRPFNGGLAWPLAGIAVVLVLQSTMIFTRAINWDEFWHYSMVELFARGTITQPLQTFFVRLFFWLPRLPGTGVDHIVIARIVMFGCEIVAAAATAALATHFTNRLAGLFAALCYLSAGLVLQHGFSFRADPVEAALLMGMLWVLTCTPFRGPWLLIFGASGAIAALYTIKCVLYVPAFAGLAYLRWSETDDKSGFAVRLATACRLAALIFASLFYLHSQAVPHAGAAAGTLLQASAEKMPSLGSPLYRGVILQAAITAPVFALLILAFPVSLTSAAVSKARVIGLAALWSEILVLGVYHNTAQYFYVFILPPVAVACAVPLAWLLARLRPSIVMTALVSFAFLMWTGEERATIDKQRTLVRAAHLIFPTPVSYFDFCGMLGRHNKANGFLTPWGRELYRQRQVPSMRATMQRQAVPLLVEDDPMFGRLLRTQAPSTDFLPEDAAALRSTYVHFWGPFWVAGKIVPANAKQLPAEFLVPGPYTVSGSDIEIDGRLMHSGALLRLQRGTHRLSNVGGRPARLTWGDHLRLPDEPPPPEPMWVWF